MEHIVNLDPQALEAALREGALDAKFVQKDTGMSLVHMVACLDPWYYMGNSEAQDMEHLEWFEDQRIYMLDILSKWGAPFDLHDDHGDTPLDVVHVDTREDVKKCLTTV